MSKIINTVVTGIVTALLPLISSEASSYFSGNGGTIRVSRLVPIGGAETTLVFIENESQRVVNDVTFELPASVQPSQITADTAVKIVDNGIASNQALRTVTVGLSVLTLKRFEFLTRMKWGNRMTVCVLPFITRSRLQDWRH